jgi:hypothetical protein
MERKAIGRVEQLVKTAAQNILDALGEIKEIKSNLEDQPMSTDKVTHYPEPNGRVTTVRQHAHGVTVMGNYDPKTTPRWKATETPQGTTYSAADLPEPVQQPKRFSKKQDKREQRTFEHKRSAPYKRQRRGQW